MTDNKTPNDSVHDEQFSKDAENNQQELTNNENKQKPEQNDAPGDESTTSNEPEEKSSRAKEEDVKATEESTPEATSGDEETQSSDQEEGDKASEKDKGQKKKEDSGSKDDEKPIPQVNYTVMSKHDLVNHAAELLNSFSIPQLKDHMDLIKSSFYKKHKAEIEEKKKVFFDQGGLIEDFKPEVDPLETQFKDIYKEYQDKKTEYNRKLEEEKQNNLQEKYQIIEDIKDLVNRKESLNKTFQDFRELQKRWREVGIVPQQNLKDLWDSYHHHVEKFYDYIKINKELRDLDLKKNLEAKLKLCEQAEELLFEPNIVEAFKTLQTYHDQWREIGPVPRENRSEIWERFKEATTKINKKHQEYFVNLKEEQKKNLEQKTALCEKAEEIKSRNLESFRDWNKSSDELIEIQKVWRTIGFAPKKDNNKIYDRFRSACDDFFSRKREFFAKAKEEQQKNLQIKTDLCIQAEALKDSSEWKKTTEDLIALQKKWKEVGPVPRKHSDQIWKRFRAACDTFFNRKSEFFADIDSKYEDNLKLKEDLIKRINEYQIKPNDPKSSFEELKKFQREWASIGFVPIKKKEEIQRSYREAINAKFDALRVDDQEKSVLKYKAKLEDLHQKPKGDQRINKDRDKIFNKIKQLENDITLWENNIGFFSNSKNAQSMINEVERKIENAKRKIEVLEEKLRLIDDMTD